VLGDTDNGKISSVENPQTPACTRGGSFSNESEISNANHSEGTDITYKDPGFVDLEGESDDCPSIAGCPSPLLS
jgi:hypothetical protein